MTVTELQNQIKQLEDTKFQRLMAWVVTEEKDRRDAQPAVEQAQAEVVKELQDAGKLPLPDALTDAEKLPEDANDVPEWRDPGTDHSMMYREGDIVRYGDKIVRSTHKGLNSWEPGTLNSGWLDVTPPLIDEETGEPKIIAWGVGQEVQPGDLRTHDGQTWRCKTAHTTHEGWVPSPEAQAVWEPVT